MPTFSALGGENRRIRKWEASPDLALATNQDFVSEKEKTKRARISYK